jgi:hypothetical protein
MVKIHIENNIKESKEKSEWEDKRRSHFGEQVTNDIRLQNEEAGPPEKNWVWEYDRVPLIVNNKQTRKLILYWFSVNWTNPFHR